MKISYVTIYLLFFQLFLIGKPSRAENPTQDLTTVPFNLRTAINYAIDNAASFDSVKKELEIAELEKENAFSAFLPSLNFSTTHGLSDGAPRTSVQPWASSLNLTLTENLYDNGASYTKHKISELKLEKARHVFHTQRNKICLEIASEYVRFSLYSKLAEIQQSQLKLIQKQYSLVANDYYQGVRTRKDFLRFKTQVSRAEIDLLNAKNNVESSSLNLLKLIGMERELNTEYIFFPVEFSEKPSFLNKPKIEIEHHSEYATLELQRQIIERQTDLVERKIWPEVYFTAGASYGSSQYWNTDRSFRDNDRYDWNALITIKYNFWDWGIRSRDRAINLSRSQVENNTLTSTYLDLENQIEQLMLKFQRLQSDFKLAKELLTLEQSNISYLEREYRNGTVQYLDLITGLQDLTDAQIKYFTALADLQTGEFTYMYHQGTLYDFISDEP